MFDGSKTQPCREGEMSEWAWTLNVRVDRCSDELWKSGIERRPPVLAIDVGLVGLLGPSREDFLGCDYGARARSCGATVAPGRHHCPVVLGTVRQRCV